jgi:hypothetical protein
MQENIHACIVELKVTADAEGGEAATAYRPKAEQGQSSPSRYWILRCLRPLSGSVSAAFISSMPKLSVCKGGTRRLNRSAGRAREASRDYRS